MSLLSRIFGRREQSRLANLVHGITPESIRRAALARKDTESRIATLVSLTVLRIASDFARDVRATMDRFAVQRNAPDREAAVFDIAVFECVAFCHYTLMAPYLRAHDADEELADENDPFIDVLRAAAHLSGGLITSNSDFGLADDFFMNRIISYGLVRSNKSDVFSQFHGILAASIEDGSPRLGRSQKVSLDLPLSLALTATVLPFCTTMLPALKEVARNAYDHADDLGLLV